jgi:hypothetical protein
MTAFKDPNNTKLTVVILNKSDSADSLTLTLNGCTPTSSAVYRSSSSEHWASIGSFSNPVSLPAKSITTIAFDVSVGPQEKLSCSSSAGGSVTTPGEGDFNYAQGTYATIIATPDQYYHFVNWTGTAADAGKVADPNTASTTVLMDADYTVVANFEANPPDTNAPTPNPMTWASPPTATGAYSITMTATTATDDYSPPVQYYFECTTDGSKSSGWQSSATYTATGLTPNTLYSFRVEASDSAPTPNVTGWSSTLSATTQSPPTDVNIIGSWVTGTTHAKETGYSRALIFIAHAERTGAVSLNSVNYGGQAMTKVIDRVVSGGNPTTYDYVAAFILNEANIVDANSSGTFAPNWSATPDSGQVAYGSVFLSNVNQTTLVGAEDSNGTASSTPNPITTSALATNNGDMVIDAATCGNAGTYTLYNGFTKALEDDMTSSTGADGYKSATGVNETPSAGHTNVNRQVIIGFVVQAAAVSYQTCSQVIAANYRLPSDLNGDCYVNFEDLAVFVSYWLSTDCTAPDNCHGADFAPTDGTVDFFDFSDFASQWMQCNDPQNSNCAPNW